MSTLLVVKSLGIAGSGGVLPPATELYFDGTNSVNSSCNSVPIYVANKDTIGLQISVPANASINGTISMQGTNDYSYQEGNMQPDVNLINWAPIAMWDEQLAVFQASKAIVASTSIVSYLLSVHTLSCRWWQIVWTNTSGSANLTIRAQIKGMGGR